MNERKGKARFTYFAISLHTPYQLPVGHAFPFARKRSGILELRTGMSLRASSPRSYWAVDTQPSRAERPCLES